MNINQKTQSSIISGCCSTASSFVHDYFGNESGSAASASGPAAGAFNATANTGAIAAADNAVALGMLRTPFSSRCGDVVADEGIGTSAMNSPL
jgi:hypothetical protein